MRKKPKWVKRGTLVEWEGQGGIVVRERICKVTEPQPGNYVLHTTLAGKTNNAWGLFPINFRQVTPVEEATHAAD